MGHIKTPKVSVIMGIYNCEETLPDAIESILSQTYSNLELIMCDDGSIDNTYNIASGYAKRNKKVKLLKNSENKGLAYTLNECLKYSKGSLIARQDGDDVSTTNRIQKQVDAFVKNSGLSIVSTGKTLFDETGNWGQVIYPANPTKYDFIKECPFCHGPAMMTKKALITVNGYDSTKKSWRAEDYDLWFRMYAAGFIGENLQESLYFVRDDRSAMQRRKFRYRIIEAHIKYRGFRLLKVPLLKYVYILRPIIVGFVPRKLYSSYRKRRYILESS